VETGREPEFLPRACNGDRKRRKSALTRWCAWRDRRHAMYTDEELSGPKAGWFLIAIFGFYALVIVEWRLHDWT